MKLRIILPLSLFSLLFQEKTTANMHLAENLLTNAKRPVEWEVNRNKNIGISFTKCKRFQEIKGDFYGQKILGEILSL